MSRFSATWARTRDDLEQTFRKWGVGDYLVRPPQNVAASALNRPAWDTDGEVSVVFTDPHGHPLTLTSKVQRSPASNLRVLYLAIEALRMNEQRGLTDVMRDAYLQLPAPQTERDPYSVLGVRPDAPREVVEASYSALAKQKHPDKGGTAEDFDELTKAREKVNAERGWS